MCNLFRPKKMENLDIRAPQAHTRKRLVVNKSTLRRRVYKASADTNVVICKRGGAR